MQEELLLLYVVVRVHLLTGIWSGVWGSLANRITTMLGSEA